MLNPHTSCDAQKVYEAILKVTASAPGFHGFQLRGVAEQHLCGETGGGRDAFVDF